MNRFFHIVYLIIKPIVAILFPHRVVGLENLPEGGALLCANHASGWDPVLIAVCLPNDSRLSFMGKDSLFRIPVLGWLIRKLGAFPVKRGGNDLVAMMTAMKALTDGRRVRGVLEGTGGAHLVDPVARSGVAGSATRTGTPMIPIYCGGKHKLFRRTTVVFGEPYCPVIAGRRPTPEENHQAAEEILSRIYAMAEVDGWK